ncbi:hypothetical protein CLOSTASPAR_04336 [[Clostridium] asparagiforme DSM 15981]|uniref:Uncharacterized protein n=1 Tax=[Clostridium] asparagiforme DSM 15981 TaxID=518636 RepID=C0D4Y8_9FIRM|nr:hypothetical protein CLOSTASPAR_04336 [[Clostridium] asparagiforme DSM 15981]
MRLLEIVYHSGGEIARRREIEKQQGYETIFCKPRNISVEAACLFFL